MGIILKVTPEVLIQMAGEIEKQIDDIEKQFQVIEAEVERTRAFWEGDASDAHKKQYDSLKDEISSSVTRLRVNPSNLLKMAGLYKETESGATQQALTLSADVII